MWPPAAAAPPSCSADFPQLWHSFVHAFVDVLHARGPVATRAAPQSSPSAPPPHVLPPVPRLVAVGDLHGDIQKARRAFKVAGLIDEQDRWAGGTTTVVQVGDLLDRGDQEIQLLYFLERLQRQAAAAGGALHVLNGNHETMNVAGQYRYVTRGAMHSFKDWLHGHTMEAALKAKCGCEASAIGLRHLLRQHGGHSAAPQQQQPLQPGQGQGQGADGGGPASSGTPGSGAPATAQHFPHSTPPEARRAALQPGGELTRRFLAPNPVVLQVGSTLFVHGGVLRQHVEYGLGRINQEVQDWMLHGKATDKPKFLSGRQGVVWARHYSAHDGARCDCEQLAEVLGKIPGAQRMVVGHTIQESGINSACQGQVVRIDVGLSRGCGNGSPEVLEILNDTVVRRLTEVQQENAVPTRDVHQATAKQQPDAAAAQAGQQQQQQQQKQPPGQVPAAAVAPVPGLQAAAAAPAPAAAVLQGVRQQQQPQPS